MKKSLILAGLTVLATMSLYGQGRGRGQATRGQAPSTNPGISHSNAPLRAPSASAQRELGKDRAEEVGRGKKKGLYKVQAEEKRKEKKK